MTATAKPGGDKRGGFAREVGLLSAVSINMTQMVGIGPFITIPLVVAAMGGPQAVIGWIVGAVLALADGLVWSELGAAMPGAGGSYIYLREAFQYRTGRLMPFLFVWTAVLFIPLIMSTGVIGLVQYLGFFQPHMSYLEVHGISIAVVVIIVAGLYRRIESVKVITVVLWSVMLASIGAVIIAAFSDFSAHLAFTYPPGAFSAGHGFFVGLGAALVLTIYDYLGYDTTAYMGDEMRNPGRVIPRSIVLSILAVMVLYLALEVGVLGAVPWQHIVRSSSVASLVIQGAWGKAAADAVTALIVITAFASVFTGLLGGSRVPYNAAHDGVFFKSFGKLHPRYRFPHVALIVMALITIIGSFFTLATVINMLTAVIVIVQAVAQIAALTVLRRRQPDLPRPYRQWLYPLPSLAALAGWIYVYGSAGRTSIILSCAWLAAGIIAYLIWARFMHAWPFGQKRFWEAYREQAGLPGAGTAPTREAA
ncbi:MAG: APC family permease [Actinomycetota bacterium]|nr:APC family permease [Actinomycetota bacterium]